jgi:hypothetical protein
MLKTNFEFTKRVTYLIGEKYDSLSTFYRVNKTSFENLKRFRGKDDRLAIKRLCNIINGWVIPSVEEVQIFDSLLLGQNEPSLKMYLNKWRGADDKIGEKSVADVIDQVMSDNINIKIVDNNPSPFAQEPKDLPQLKRVHALILKALEIKFSPRPTSYRSFINEHIEVLEDILKANANADVARPSVIRYFTDFLQGKRVPFGKALAAFADFLGIDYLELYTTAVEDMRVTWHQNNIDEWFRRHDRHGGNTKMFALFDEDIKSIRQASSRLETMISKLV